MAQMGKSSKRAHPKPPSSPNHREYIRDVSPEMAAEYDAPLMRGTACASPGKAGSAKTGTEQKLRSTR
jgi:hypothetical protein